MPESSAEECSDTARAEVAIEDGVVSLGEVRGTGIVTSRPACAGAELKVEMDKVTSAQLSEYVYGVRSINKDGTLCSYEGVDGVSSTSSCVLATVSDKNVVYKHIVEKITPAVPNTVKWDGSLSPGEDGIQYYLMPEVKTAI